MNLAQCSFLPPPTAPIVLRVWPKQEHGLATLNEVRRRPFEEDVLIVLKFITKHPGTDYPSIVKGCGLHRNRVNTVVHRLIRADKVEGKGNPGKKRYWAK